VIYSTDLCDDMARDVILCSSSSRPLSSLTD